MRCTHSARWQRRSPRGAGDYAPALKGNQGTLFLALMRRMALNIARNEPGKDAMRGKLKRAGWDNRFLSNMRRAAANRRQTTARNPNAIALAEKRYSIRVYGVFCAFS